MAGKRLRSRPAASGADDRILAAAEQLFAQHGYDAVTNQQIAARAGLTIGALYHYFPSKDAVYAAAIERAFSTKGVLPPQVTDLHVAAEERLSRLAAWFVGIIMADQNAGRLVQRELLDPRADTAAIIHTALFQSAFDLFQVLLKELLPHADLDDALASLLALLFGFANLKGVKRLAPAVSGLLASPEEIGRHATALLLRGLQG